MTVEAAIALAGLVVVIALCVGAVLAASTQIRIVDAAREAARLAARGDSANAISAAGRLAPAGARIDVRAEGDSVIAVVSARPALFPVDLRAEAVAAREPGVTARTSTGGSR